MMAGAGPRSRTHRVTLRDLPETSPLEIAIERTPRPSQVACRILSRALRE
jgi:hypothetical protein